MKKILTIAVCEKPQSDKRDSFFDDVEILYRRENETAAEFLRNAAKSVKSKYTVIVDGEFTFADLHSFLDAAGKANADILVFTGGYCFKSAVLRALDPKNIGNRYCTELFAAMNAKSIARLKIEPLRFRGMNTAYSEEAQQNLAAAIREFGVSKSKMPKDVYSFTFDILCARLADFYMSAMLAVRRKETAANKLAEFDKLLKTNVVLYLALEKRFKAAKLSKLRKKNFLISFLTAEKFKKELKK